MVNYSVFKHLDNLGKLIGLSLFWRLKNIELTRHSLSSYKFNINQLSTVQEMISFYAKKENPLKDQFDKIINNRIKQISKNIGTYSSQFTQNIQTLLYFFMENNFTYNDFSIEKILNSIRSEVLNIQRGIFIREFRYSQGLTILEMADFIKVNEKNIQAWEAHKRNLPVNIYNKLNQFSDPKI
ncbi:hypothetical protein OZX61_12650 (plasmid) [Acinetobacter sp. ESL0695]|uniref:hypothetical protein n=1 Tax=Acinetobacter sp. ESL0695 TaxID=2983215 RepID=UPI0023F4E4C3|nr:hypothetical protein [Acinetobacter sp. ESL0695]WEV50242.1 hypothetical protein OZX61_12650 [Acinetobacter sp. ESL0695]